MEVVSGEQAQELLDGANKITLADPGFHCGKHCPDMPVSGTCHGEHPTGRLTMLVIEAGEETERVCVAEPGDAALLGAAPALARTVVVRERELIESRADAAALRARIAGRTTPPTDPELDAAFAAGGGWMVAVQAPAGGWTRPWFIETPEQAKHQRESYRGSRFPVRWSYVDNDGLPADWPDAAPATPSPGDAPR